MCVCVGGVRDSHTIVHPVAQVAFPPPLVQEGDEGVDVGPARAAAHYGVGGDDW